ncbi:MAG TPA: carbohydrate ABC transporter permease, partial [Actinomycetota bacterium]|nr:carbohydrate ABC transporter permease [Actinomycetota bacterium]
MTAVSSPGARAGPVVIRRQVPASVRRRRRLMAVANHSVAIALSIMFLVPFAFIVSTALMTNQQMGSLSIWPSPFRWANFTDLFEFFPFWRFAWNSLLYAGLGTVGVVLSGIPVAYALSRMRWRGRQVSFVLLLSTLMLPVQVTIVP